MSLFAWRTGDHMVRSKNDKVDSNFGDRDKRIAVAVAEYQAMLESGLGPDRTAFLLLHAELAEELAPCIEALEFVGRLVPVSSLSTGTPSNRLSPNSMLGDFRIVKKIGSGGMGDVYEAQQVSLGRRVALKVLPAASSLDERSLQRFCHEAQAAATLQHPHIVPVYAVGSVGDIHYYAMQYIEGDSLAHVVSTWRTHNSAELDTAKLTPKVAHERESSSPRAEKRPMQVVGQLSSTPLDVRGRPFFRDVARMISQAADALQHAHDCGIVHRDIKPGNLLIDTKGEIWVADFGLAKLPDSNLTGTTDVMGTLRYMSPEQASGRAVALDGRTDIYSLGVTLYEMLTLRPVFEAEDRRALLRKVLEEEPRSLRLVCPTLPKDLETITHKAIEKEPQDRYQFACEFADDLRRFLSDHTIRAKPPTLQEMAKKWVKRNRLVAGAMAISFFVLLIMGVASLSITLVVIDRSRDETKSALERETIALRTAKEANKASDKMLLAEKDARASENKLAYSLSVSLADAEMRSGNIEAAEALLSRCPHDLRDWEWGYLFEQCHGELNTVPIKTEYVDEIAMLPTGETAAFASEGASLWSFPNGVLVENWPSLVGTKNVRQTKLSRDGKYIVRYSQTHSFFGRGQTAPVAIFEVFSSQTGLLTSSFSGHSNPIKDVEMNTQSTHVVSAGSDGMRIWDFNSETELKAIRETGLTDVAFAHGSDMFATKNRIGKIKLYTGMILAKTIMDEDARHHAIDTLEFSPDDRKVASEIRDGNIKLWDTNDGKSIRTIPSRMGSRGLFIFSPDGLWLATTDHEDHSICIWNVDSGLLQRRIMQRSSETRQVHFSVDGTCLVALSGDKALTCWDLTKPDEGRVLGSIQRRLSESEELYLPCFVQISREGGVAALACHNHILLCALDTGQSIRELLNPSSAQLTYAVEIDESGGTVRQLTNVGIVHWHLNDGVVVRKTPVQMRQIIVKGKFDADQKRSPPKDTNPFDIIGAGCSPQSSILCENGRYLFDDLKHNEANYWFSELDSEDDSYRKIFLGSVQGRPYCLARSRDGQHYAAAGLSQNNLLNWNADSSLETWRIETPHRVLSMRYNDQGSCLAIADAGGNLKIYDVETGNVLNNIAVPIQLKTQIAFTPNGRRIAIAVGRPSSQLGEVRICDVVTGQTLIKIPLDSGAESVDFTPDGKQLLASDYKGRLWVFDSVSRSLASKIQDLQQNKSGWHLDRVAEAESSKNYRAAIWHIDHLLAIQPNDESLVARRTALIAKSGEFANLDAVAADKLEQTLSLKNLSTAYRLSAEYITRGDAVSHQRLCRRLFAQVNAQTPPFDASQVYRLGTLGPSAVEDMEALIKSCEEKFSDGSSDSQFALPFLLGMAYYRTGRLEEAKAELSAMLQIKRSTPSYPIALLFLAMTEKRLGNEVLAEAAFSKAENRYSEDKASRKNGEVIFFVDFHYPLLRQEYKSKIVAN